MLHRSSEHDRLDGEIALLKAIETEWSNIERGASTVANELGHGLPRGQRMHDAVASEAGALDEPGRF